MTSRWLTESASGPDFVDARLSPLATTPARRAGGDGAVCEAVLLPFAAAAAAVLESLGLAVAALLFLARLALVSGLGPIPAVVHEVSRAWLGLLRAFGLFRASVSLSVLLLLLQGPPLLLSMAWCSSGCRRHPDTGLRSMQ